MRIVSIILFFALIGSTDLSAQSQATIDKAAAHGSSCMMMSDSMSTALLLTDEQRDLVRQADERCLEACEKAGYRTTGRLDDMAMHDHNMAMRDVLSPEQYERWNAMCSAGHAKGSTPPSSDE